MLKDLFRKDTKTIAKNILGMFLVHESSEGKTVGKIVETEAYLHDDPATHSFHGKTVRNAPMFGRAGTAYVYFTYGMHYCFNVVTAKEGVGEAVLIRALEPVEGLTLMRKRRKIEDISQLCNGPAKLVQAMGIHKEHNGVDLLQHKKLFLLAKDTHSLSIVKGKRVGISKGQDLPLRFCIKDTLFVSHKI